MWWILGCMATGGDAAREVTPSAGVVDPTFVPDLGSDELAGVEDVVVTPDGALLLLLPAQVLRVEADGRRGDSWPVDDAFGPVHLGHIDGAPWVVEPREDGAATIRSLERDIERVVSWEVSGVASTSGPLLWVLGTSLWALDPHGNIIGTTDSIDLPSFVERVGPIGETLFGGAVEDREFDLWSATPGRPARILATHAVGVSDVQVQWVGGVDGFVTYALLQVPLSTGFETRLLRRIRQSWEVLDVAAPDGARLVDDVVLAGGVPWLALTRDEAPAFVLERVGRLLRQSDVFDVGATAPIRILRYDPAAEQLVALTDQELLRVFVEGEG